MTDELTGRREEGGGDAGRRFDQQLDETLRAARTEPDPDAWQALLDKKKKSKQPHPTVNNAAVIFENDPALRGLVAFNDFSNEPMLLRAPPPLPALHQRFLPGPYPRAIDAGDLPALIAHYERHWSRFFSDRTVKHAMVHASFLSRFHPVRDWLNGLRWDGKERVDTWLMHCFGLPDTPYHRAVGSKLLIAAVRRIMRPGAKFDTMLVVEGDQGLGKSTVFRALFGDEWFTDDMHKNLESVEAGRSIQGKWCVEMGEIQQILKHDPEVVKDWLSKQTDRIRPHWSNVARDFPRQTIFVGTTNEDTWLRDPTGNRRFWPVRATRADPDWIRSVRAQLFAEAVIRERLGPEHAQGSIHLDNVLLNHLAVEEQRKREFHDPWVELVRDWVRGRPCVRTEEILRDGLLVPIKDLNQSAAMRVGKILRKDGWVRKLTRPTDGREDNATRWYFLPPS